MKQRVWKAGLIVALVVAVGGSATFAAAAAAGTNEPAPAAGTAASAQQPAPATGTAPAPAQEPAKAAAPAAPAHEELLWPEFWQTFHHPTSWLSMGADERLRIEAGENWQTLNTSAATDHRWEYERYRTRWWTKSDLSEDVSFNTRLVWEFRTWEDPETKAQYINPRGTNPHVTDFNPDEALFDWFNVNWRNIGGLPLTATIGRQDLAFGTGWLILDASPLDGSRTIGAFDAARFTYDWSEINTKVDAVYVNNYPESDRWLKPINDQYRGLMEQEEQAAILYLTNTSLKPLQLEGYFIYKQDQPLPAGKTLTNFPAIWGEKGDVYTFGGAFSGIAAEHWKYRAEGAFETGRKAGDQPGSQPNSSPYGPTEDLRAFGTLDTIEYMFKDAHDNATHLTYEYDSGDDPGTTSRDERFDLLWGRWPRWSELLIYTWANETRVADTTNLHRLNIGHRINLTKQWQVTGDYHALWADQNTGAVSASKLSLSPSKNFRGSLYTTSLRYKMNDQLSAYALLEYFTPGDYYVSPSDKNAYFWRINFEYVF
jgi:hypothetical protein